MIRIATSGGRILAVILFAILSWLGWPASGFAPLLFVAWIPLLAYEDSVAERKRDGFRIRFFPLTYLAFFLFNLITTWWIYFASPFGMMGAVMANALIMTFVFWMFHQVKFQLGKSIGYVFLVAAWLAFEYLHLDWDLTWPWLNLGNGFAAYTGCIQWYEFTGTGGGTLWILCMNILLYEFAKSPSLKRVIAPAILLIVPVLFSQIIIVNYAEHSNSKEVIIVQPNIDPYNEKFSGMSSDEQLSRMLQLASSVITPSTKLMLLPETALPDGIWEEQINQQEHIRRLTYFAAAHPGLYILTGAATYRFYDGKDYPATARKFGNTDDHYDAFNSALLINKDSVLAIYHKSKLVPGVEKMPYPVIFGYLDQFAIDLGGIAGSLGMQDSSEVFRAPDVITAPVICYESIYGDYIGTYVRRGAQMISIITNDGWWGDTPGYRQHLQYGRLRAIEHRRSIARCANTGISCFIDQLGNVHQKSTWWTPQALRGNVNLNDYQTFYTRHGDYLGRFGLMVGMLLLAYSFLRSRLSI